MVFGLGWLLNRMSAASGRTIDPAPVQALQAQAQAVGEEAAPFRRWAAIFARMTLRLVPEYIVLVLLLGAARAWLFPHISADADNHPWWIAGLAVAGALFVIPTAGEVPIIQAMLSLGMAAGPAAALLMTLPPISLPSIAMLAGSFRRAELATAFAGVVATGLAAPAGPGGIALGVPLSPSRPLTTPSSRPIRAHSCRPVSAPLPLREAGVQQGSRQSGQLAVAVQRRRPQQAQHVGPHAHLAPPTTSAMARMPPAIAASEER